MAKLNIAVVYGSVRSGRVGINAARWVEKELKKRKHNVTLIDPKEYQFPLLYKRLSDYPKGKVPKSMQKVSKIFKKADAIVVVSAEYNHSIPPALSNLMDHFYAEYKRTPSGIITYSVGSFGGARAAIQLREFLSALGSIPIPLAFPISSVQKVFDTKGNLLDVAYQSRFEKFITELEWYAHALKE